MDLSGLLNPRRVIDRREAEAEAEPTAPEPSKTRFERPFTPEERARQRRLLVQKLRELDRLP